jgi:hypothetical protein
LYSLSIFLVTLLILEAHHILGSDFFFIVAD